MSSAMPATPVLSHTTTMSRSVSSGNSFTPSFSATPATSASTSSRAFSFANRGDGSSGNVGRASTVAPTARASFVSSTALGRSLTATTAPRSSRVPAPADPAASLTPSERQQWETSTIATLQSIERDQRAAAERKKEELRQLVGVRYRVLIACADSIAAMKDESESMQRSIQLIQTKIAEINNTNPESLADTVNDETSTRILRDLSLSHEQLSGLLIRHEFVAAIKRYAEVQRSVQQLTRMEPPKSSGTSSQPSVALSLLHSPKPSPMLPPASISSLAPVAADASQWNVFVSHHLSALDQFPDMLEQFARTRLLDQTLSAEAYSEAITALLFATDMDMKGAARVFLSSRLQWMTHILFSAHYSAASFPRSSAAPVVEAAVIRLAQAVQMTVVHSRLLFGTLHEDHSPLHVPSRCEKISEQLSVAGDYQLPHEQLSSLTREWLNVAAHIVLGPTDNPSPPTSSSAFTLPCTEATVPALSSLLRRLRTGRQLAKARDRLLDVLIFTHHASWMADILQHSSTDAKHNRWNDERDDDDKQTKAGDHDLTANGHNGRSDTDADDARRQSQYDLFTDACFALFSSSTSPVGRLSLWDLFFASPFSARCRELVSASFAKLRFHQTIEQILEAWNHENADSEEKESTVNDSLWSGFRQQAVDSLVSSFARQLTALANDVRHLLNCPTATAARATVSASKSSHSPSSASSRATRSDLFSFLNLVRFLDDELTPMIGKLYKQSVDALVDQLRRRLSQLEHGVWSTIDSPDRWRGEECQRFVDQAVFIGRCCHAIQQQPAFIDFNQTLTQTTDTVAASSTAPSSSGAAIQRALSSTVSSAFHVWTRYIANTLSEDLAQEFRDWHSQASANADSVTKTFLTAIQSTAPGTPASGRKGQSEESKTQSTSPVTPLPFPVPSASSPYIARFLFALQHSLYRIHSSDVSSDVLSWLFTDVGIAALNVYKPSYDLDVDGLSNDNRAALPQEIAAMTATAKLQLLFDLVFLFSSLRLPAASTNKTKSLSAASGLAEPRSELLSLSEQLQSTLSRELGESVWLAGFSSLVLQCQAAINRSQLLFGVFHKRNPLPALTVAEMTNSSPTSANSSALVASASSSAPLPLMPLAPNTARLVPFSTSFYPTNKKAPTSALNGTAASSSALKSATSVDAITSARVAMTVANPIALSSNVPLSASAAGAAISSVFSSLRAFRG